MKCYVKSISTFLTEAQRDTEEYNLVMDSMDGERSTLTLLSEDAPSSLNGNWLVMNGEVWRIDTSSPKQRKTQLNMVPVDTLFDRMLVYEESNAATVGAFMAGVISSEWINQSDAVYATPYITVTSTDDTVFVAPETEEGGTYNFLDYIRKMRKDNNVVIHAALSGNTILLTIAHDAVVTHPLVLNDGHTQLVSSDFKNTALAKITVYKKVDSGQTDADDNPVYTVEVSDWYLASDGTVSDTAPLERETGEWGCIQIAENDDPQEKATEEFGKNEKSRKIELYSDVSMKVGDLARIRINGDIVETTVTGIYRKKGEARTRYKLGDLITTLSEKLDAVSSGKTVVVRSGGGGATYPAWTGGSY